MKRWQYEPAADLDQTLIERLRNFPRQPDMLVYGLRSFVALIIRGLLRTYCLFEIIGEENLRKPSKVRLSCFRTYASSTAGVTRFQGRRIS